MEMHSNMKNKLLSKLMSRMIDKHAFGRSFTLNLLIQLCEENVIPVDILQDLLKESCTRIKDASAHVRKKALQLLNIIIKIYYSIFVESQNNNSFMSEESLDEEYKKQKQEIEELQEEIQKIEEDLNKVSDEEMFEQLQAEKNSLKRKIDVCTKTEKKILQYKNVLESFKNVIKSCFNLL